MGWVTPASAPSVFKLISCPERPGAQAEKSVESLQIRKIGDLPDISLDISCRIVRIPAGRLDIAVEDPRVRTSPQRCQQVGSSRRKTVGVHQATWEADGRQQFVPPVTVQSLRSTRDVGSRSERIGRDGYPHPRRPGCKKAVPARSESRRSPRRPDAAPRNLVDRGALPPASPGVRD